MIPIYLYCDGCKKMHNADDIYEFWGNVMHPCGGGFIGQNIFTNVDKGYVHGISYDKAELSRGVKVIESDDKSVRIYALRYCRACCFRIFKIKEK